MKAIQLTQGKYALVDDEDFERVNQFKWCANRMGNVWYAVRRGCGNLGRMHRFIVAGNDMYLGCYSDTADAARVYDVAAREHFGEFANTNF
jgi:hypothetical protein